MLLVFFFSKCYLTSAFIDKTSEILFGLPQLFSFLCMVVNNYVTQYSLVPVFIHYLAVKWCVPL